MMTAALADTPDGQSMLLITHGSILWCLVKWRQTLDRFLLSMMLLPRIERDAEYQETGKPRAGK